MGELHNNKDYVSKNHDWATEPDTCLSPVIASSGPASKQATTVVRAFADVSKKYANRPALHFQLNGSNKASFQFITWKEYYELASRFAKALISIGFKQHSRLAISGFNHHNWFITMMGTILSGGIAAGVYPTNTPDQCEYIMEHSQAEVLVLENNKLLERYKPFLGMLKSLKAVVLYNEQPGCHEHGGKPIYSFEDFLTFGESINTSKVEARMASQSPGHCCSLIYTSGTTGFPKAVMISHDNATWTAAAMLQGHNGDVTMGPNDRTVSYLPLSHIAAQLLDIFCPLIDGFQVFFAQPDALKGSLVHTLKIARPTFFFGVPRVWEKMHEKLASVGATAGPAKRALARAAKAIGLARARAHQYPAAAAAGRAGGNNPWGYAAARRLVFGRLRRALGLDVARYCYVAAAPVKAETLEYFASLDVHIYEVFGQSECTGPHTVSTPGRWRLGACGVALGGTRTRVDPATGELQYRGRHIMMGYLRNPEATAAAVLPGGWLCSGDMAALDGDGFLRITGRLKELIITSGGENVAPAPIEAALLRALPELSHAMVVGEKRNYLCALLCLQVKVGADGAPAQELEGAAMATSRRLLSAAATVAAAAACPAWKTHLDQGVAAANREAVSNACTVKKWVVLPAGFSEAGGELTPTLKLKRRAVDEKYARLIEDMYGNHVV